MLALYSLDSFSRNSYAVKPWPLSQMLNQETILSIVQSYDGTLWIGTLAGVDRYNGNEFELFRPNFSQEGHIASASIVKIVETNDGEIFVATADAGLLAFDEASNRFIRLDWINDEKLDANRVSTAFSSRDGSIWTGLESGHIVRFIPELQRADSIELDNGKRITGISQSQGGQILAASASGKIFEIHNDLREYHEIEPAKSCLDNFSELDAIASLSDQFLWLGTRDNGLLLLDTENGSCIRPYSTKSTGRPISTADIHEIHVDSQTDSTWVATDQGLYKIGPKLEVSRLGTDNSNLSNY